MPPGDDQSDGQPFAVACGMFMGMSVMMSVSMMMEMSMMVMPMPVFVMMSQLLHAVPSSL